MTARTALVMIAGQVQQLPAGDTLAGVSGLLTPLFLRGGDVLTLNATDTVQALAAAAGVQYTWDYLDGAQLINPTPRAGNVPISVNVIWATLAAGAVARLTFSETANPAAPGTQVTVYKNGSTQVIANFVIPPLGTAYFDGNRVIVQNAQGTLQ